jgi:cell division protein FtsB
MNTSMADPIEKLEQLQGVAVDTNRTAKKIDAKTERSRTKRLSAFALVMLLLYFLVTLGLTIKDLNSSVRNLNRTTPALVQSNKNLTDTNQRLAQANNRAQAERNAAVNIAAVQAQRLRDAGLPAVDPFDPRNFNPTSKAPTTRPGTTQNKPSKGSKTPSAASEPSPRSSPRPSAKPTPAPSKSPTATICAPNLPCVTIPPLTAPLAVSGAVLQGDQVDSSIDFLNPTAAATVKVLSVFIPLLVAVITKRYATGALKGVMNFVLSVFTGSIGYLVAVDGGYDFAGFVNAALNCVVVSAASYYVLWKPTGAAASVAVATENFGIGKPALTTDDVGKAA